MTLSKMQITVVCLFDFAILAIVPKQGPINGSQNLIRRISGFSLLIKNPVKIQLIGFIELILRVMLIPCGGGLSVYCDFPGKSNFGYCNLKVKTLTSCPSAENCCERRSLKVAGPPLYGKAGPIEIIFINFIQINS